MKISIATIRSFERMMTFDPCVGNRVYPENGNYWISVRMMEKCSREKEIKSGGDRIDIVVNDRVS